MEDFTSPPHHHLTVSDNSTSKDFILIHYYENANAGTVHFLSHGGLNGLSNSLTQCHKHSIQRKESDKRKADNGVGVETEKGLEGLCGDILV